MRVSCLFRVHDRLHTLFFSCVSPPPLFAFLSQAPLYSPIWQPARLGGKVHKHVRWGAYLSPPHDSQLMQKRVTMPSVFLSHFPDRRGACSQTKNPDHFTYSHTHVSSSLSPASLPLHVPITGLCITNEMAETIRKSIKKDSVSQPKSIRSTREEGTNA